MVSGWTVSNKFLPGGLVLSHQQTLTSYKAWGIVAEISVNPKRALTIFWSTGQTQHIEIGFAVALVQAGSWTLETE